MKKIVIVSLLIGVAICTWWVIFKDKSGDKGPKQQALKVGKHTSEFNRGVSNVITEYLSLKEAFVNGDTAKIKEQQRMLVAALEGIKLDELKNDTTGIFQSAQLLLGDIRSNTEAIAKETDITEMRQDFRMVSENLFPFLKTIRYEGEKLYWQNCPMAFGDDKDGSWLSNSEEIVNPYLGKNHPKYKGSMLHCGEIKDTIQSPM